MYKIFISNRPIGYRFTENIRSYSCENTIIFPASIRDLKFIQFRNKNRRRSYSGFIVLCPGSSHPRDMLGWKQYVPEYWHLSPTNSHSLVYSIYFLTLFGINTKWNGTNPLGSVLNYPLLLNEPPMETWVMPKHPYDSYNRNRCFTNRRRNTFDSVIEHMLI